MKTILRNGFEKTKAFVKEHKGELIQMGIMVAVVVVPTLMGGVCEAASNSNLPWSKGITTLKTELTGPIPTIGATVACATSGAMLAFGETNGITKKAIQATFGMGVAVGAGSLVTALTGADVTGCLF